jgi:hypothetical protein
MPKRTLKVKDFKIPAGPMSKPEDRPRPTMYDIDRQTRKSLSEMRAAMRGQRPKKK